MSIRILKTLGASKGIRILLPSDIEQMPEGCKDLGEVMGYGEARVTDQLQIEEGRIGVENSAITAVLQKAIELQADLLVVKEFRTEGMMAPTCRIIGQAWASKVL